MREAGGGTKPQSKESWADPGSPPQPCCTASLAGGPSIPVPHQVTGCINCPQNQLLSPLRWTKSCCPDGRKKLLSMPTVDSPGSSWCGWVPVRTLSFSRRGCAKPGAPSCSIFPRQQSGWGCLLWAPSPAVSTPKVLCTSAIVQNTWQGQTAHPNSVPSPGCMQQTWCLLGVLITHHFSTASDELILYSLSCPWGLSSASLALGFARAGKLRVLARSVSRVLVSCRVQLSCLKF